jgi:hypothetical protein
MVKLAENVEKHDAGGDRVDSMVQGIEAAKTVVTVKKSA